MNERRLRWYSPWLTREFEMLAFGNGGGLPLIIFPTSLGRYYQSKDFGLVGSVSAFVDAGRVGVMIVRFVIPSEVEGSRSVRVRLLRGIPRLRFARLGMTQLI